MKRQLAVLLFLAAVMLAGPMVAAPADAPAEKKAPVIPGITIERQSGDGFLGLQLVDTNFKLTFYDKKKEKMQADFKQVLLRWDVIYKKTQERVVLTPAGDGTFVTSPRVIRPPYNFQLFITLISDSKDKDSETYVIRFTQ